MKKVIVVWAVLLAVCLLGGYWVARTSAGVVQQPDTVVVSRENPLKQPHVAPLNRTIRDSQVVKALYAELQQMKPPTGGVVHCPNDNGVYYDLKFMQQQKLILEVQASLSGCRVVRTVNEKGELVKVLGMLKETDDFNDTLAHALGLARAE